jgi:chemotaxis protein CheD
MNHFMLPESETGQWGASSAAMRYGNHAMEMLINTVISSGCPRHRLEIKLFGGANVTGGTSGIGDQNAEFILRYMKNEGLAIAAMDLGGMKPRRVHYFPDTGKVKRLFVGLKGRRDVADQEQSFRQQICDAPVGGDVELFT